MSLQHFSVDKIASVRGKNAFLGHPIAQALVAGHSLIMRFKNAFKVGIVNLCDSLLLPFIVKEVRTGSENKQRDLSDAR